MKFTNEEKDKYLTKLRFKKYFFLKNFVISYVLLILAFMISMMTYDSSLAMCQRMFGLNAQFTALTYMLMFGLWKILNVQFALVPFLSAWMMERHLKNAE